MFSLTHVTITLILSLLSTAFSIDVPTDLGSGGGPVKSTPNTLSQLGLPNNALFAQITATINPTFLEELTGKPTKYISFDEVKSNELCIALYDKIWKRYGKPDVDLTACPNAFTVSSTDSSVSERSL